MGDILVGFLIGFVADKALSAVVDVVKELAILLVRFDSPVRDFGHRVDYLESLIKEGRVDDQNGELKETILDARGHLNKYSTVGISRWNPIGRYRYIRKIRRLNKALNLYVPKLELRYQTEILELSKKKIKASSFQVGLDVPLRELKRKLFTEGLSRLVITGPASSGKTELAKQLCQDDEVKDKFKKNIYFVTVSKRPDLDKILDQLYQQMGYTACIVQNNASAVMWRLEQFVMEAGQNPLLLVLDDVWSGTSESLLLKLDELNKMPNYYKLLVTSRFEFPRFGSSYYLKMSYSEEEVATAPTSANYVVPRLERIEANQASMAVDLRLEFKAEMQAFKEDFTNTFVALSQSQKEKGPERTKEIKCHCNDCTDVHTITEDFEDKQEPQILPTDLEQQKMSQFRAWIGDPEDGRRNLEISEASKKFFTDLMTPGVWLSDTHVDGFLYFLRKNPQYHSPSLTRSCTILDTVFWNWMSWQWPSFQNNPSSFEWDSDILAYPLGKSPQFTRPWSEVDDLYIPVNVTEQHWVAVRVELMRRKFTIYDSMQSATADQLMCDLLNPLATMFPSLLIRSGFYEMRPELSSRNIPFQVVRQAESVPQQSER